MSLYYLGLGSNLGDREENLALAVRNLAGRQGVQLLRGSSVFDTRPVGNVAQPDFLNMVIEVETGMAPPALLECCLSVEQGLGRIRDVRWGPRTIDIDLLFSPELEWNDGQLTLPHPRMTERAFVLAPLAELCPDLLVDKMSVSIRLARLGAEGLRRHLGWPELRLKAGLLAACRT